jgi:hypothetical protein
MFEEPTKITIVFGFRRISVGYVLLVHAEPLATGLLGVQVE